MWPLRDDFCEKEIITTFRLYVQMSWELNMYQILIISSKSKFQEHFCNLMVRKISSQPGLWRDALDESCKRDHTRPSFLSPSPFVPIFYLNLRKTGMENPRKSHPFYKPAWSLYIGISMFVLITKCMKLGSKFALPLSEIGFLKS